MNEIDELFALITEASKPKAPVAWEELPEGALTEPKKFRSEEPNYGAIRRMQEHDELPEAWRLLVHEFGLRAVRTQWKRLRNKDAEKARLAIEVERLEACLEAELPIF